MNVRVEPAFYAALEAVARQDRRSVPQVARHLMDEALRQRTGGRSGDDDLPARGLAGLASGGGGFGWLAEEPDLYDATSGEPA